MRRQRRRDTGPERAVRATLTELGAHYRVANRDLPGSPDVANRTGGWAIFVHGCYWHHHEGCPRATVPTANRDFWVEKFAANRARDARAVHALVARGFEVLVVWECETRQIEALRARLSSFLQAQPTRAKRASKS